ncbi:hypothetical protein HYU18_03165 [Candidatus Woesearchaeota archaeon]|nr:hypothetical protein [Candidatus Woesearchaeota archaeon]
MVKVKLNPRAGMLAMLMLLAALALASSASAYTVQFSKDVKNEQALRQYLASYDQARLKGIDVIRFDTNLELKGLFLVGDREKNRIILNPSFAQGKWQFNKLMDHETAHAICWRAKKDLSHDSECFEKFGKQP